jgi:hypothetical protein
VASTAIKVCPRKPELTMIITVTSALTHLHGTAICSPLYLPAALNPSHSLFPLDALDTAWVNVHKMEITNVDLVKVDIQSLQLAIGIRRWVRTFVLRSELQVIHTHQKYLVSSKKSCCLINPCLSALMDRL